MRPFEGFQRKALVIVPSDEEYKRRCTEREKEEGKDVPESAVNEMKGRPMLRTRWWHHARQSVLPPIFLDRRGFGRDVAG